MYEPPKRRKLTKSERERVYTLCGGRCAYCGTDIALNLILWTIISLPAEAATITKAQ